MSNSFGRFFKALEKAFNEAGGGGLDHLGEQLVVWGNLSGKVDAGGLLLCAAVQVKAALKRYGRSAQLCLAMPL